MLKKLTVGWDHNNIETVNFEVDPSRIRFNKNTF